MSEPRHHPGQSPVRTDAAAATVTRAEGFSFGGFGVPLHRVWWAIRRHLVLAGFVGAFTATAILIVLESAPRYRAVATLRLAGERRQISAGMEEAETPIDRTTAPLLSLVPRVRSRGVIGAVVDSLGLQVGWLPERTGWGSLGAAVPPAIALDRVRAGPAAKDDTLSVRFTTETFQVRKRGRVAEAPYGKTLETDGIAFTVPEAPDRTGALLEVRGRNRAIDRVLEELAPVPVVGTDALEIRFTDTDPARAQAVANAVATTFHSMAITDARQQATRRRQFLAAQLEETERLVRRAQGTLSSFRRRQQMASSSDGLAMQQAALAAIDTRRIEVDADRKVYVSLLEQLQGGADSTREEGLRMLAYSPEIATDPVVGRLYQQMLMQRTRLDSLTTGPWRSSETNPDVVQLQRLLGASQAELVRAVQAHLKSLDGRAAALGELRTSRADAIGAMPALQAEETYLGEEVASLSALASDLRREYQKSRMAEALQAGDVEVVDLAALPYKPVGVPWWLKAAIALLAGLGAGIVAAVLMDFRNHAIRAPEELAEAIPVRELGLIPNVETAARGRGLAALRARLLKETNGRSRVIASDTFAPSAGVEAFRLLYTSLTFGWGDGPRSLLVTSVAPQEGKTLVASNLAATFAREGARVLLVDGDLRRPQLHKLFHLPRSPGLVDYLTSTAPPAPVWDTGPREAPRAAGYTYPEAAEDTPRANGTPATGTPNLPATASPNPPPWEPPLGIRSTAIPRLWLLPCGTMPTRPAEVLRAGGMRRVLEEFTPHFDLIVIDSPPVLVSADAAMLAPLTDGVLMVIRAGETDRDAAERAYDQLSAAGAEVVGTILNDPSGQVTQYRSEYYAYDYPPTLD